MKNQVKIYQIKNIVEVMYAFRDYDKDAFNLDDYQVVAETEMEIPEEWQGAPLEYIFMRFNGSARRDFKMHSLSVSDVVELNGTKYYVNGVGFEQI